MPDAWRLAVGTLTALPARPPGRVDRAVARDAMLLAPLAVLPLAVAVTVVGTAGRGAGLPGLVVGLAAVGVLALGTRALHLDGLSDTVDGLAASFDRDRSLAVMRSGTAGPAGVVALVLVVGVQAAGLASLVAASWRGAVLAGLCVCVSRCALALSCSRRFPAARTDGLGVTYAGTVPGLAAGASWVVAALVLGGAGAWAGLPWWRGPLATGLAVLVVLAVLRHVRRRLGGVTGDVLGATVEGALATLLVALA